MEAKTTTPVVKGTVITLLLIVFGLIVYFGGQFGNSSLQYVQYAILIGGIIWSCISYAKQLEGNTTFGNIFAHGFKTTTVIICLISVYTFISFKFLFPDMVDTIINEARKNMEAQKNLTQEQLNQALDMTRKFFLPFAIGGIIFLFAIVGALASLVGAAASKKNPQSPFQQQM